MKTVVHIGYGGGVSTMMRDLSSEMPGVRFIAITFGPATVKTNPSSTSFVWQGMFRLDKYLFNTRRLRAYLTSLHPDLIVLHGFIPMALLARSAKSSISGKVVGIDVGPQPTFWLIKKILFWFSRNAIDEVASVCKESKVWFIRMYPWFKERTTVIDNGVDIRQLQSPRLRLQSQPYVVSTVSRIDAPQKDPLTLLRAGIELHRRNIPVDVYFVGDGNLLPDLKKIIIANNAQSYIHCLGHQTNYQNILDKSDIFVLSTHWEGLALSLLEAMANGLPVVASAVIGNTGVISDKQTGRLFPDRDYIKLAELIKELIEQPAIAQEMASRGKQLVQSRYTRSRMISDYQYWFEKLLGSE